MLDQLLQQLEQTNKDKKIVYPDIDDSRVCDAVMRLLEIWENPVLCWKKSELVSYKDFISNGWAYFEVPDEEENVVFAAQKLAAWEVDGFVWWNISTTTEVVKALIKNVGSREWISRISSHFLFGRDKELFLYSDAGIQIDPDAEKLAEIGELTIQNARVYGIDPRVAFLSFSTSWSGWNHPKALKMRDAANILREKLKAVWDMDTPVEWEIQFDAAYVPDVWKRKNPDTALILPANVFIFPDLDSANIAYKITERLWWATAIGPIIQWLAKPANDLSRGCSVEDIIAMHHITKNQ